MPQGKGTYGSQVGRPSKKKYNKGGNVDPFSTRNPVGVPAEQMAEAMENQNMANQGLPTSNAQERSQASPDVTSYNEGGKVKSKKVDITDVIRAVELPAEDYAKHGGSKSGAVKERVKQALAGTKKRPITKAAPEKKRPKYKKGGKVKKDAPHLKSDNPKVQKMLDEGRKRYVKKQNVLDEYEKMRPKKSKGLAAPPKDKRPRPPKNSMKNQGKKKKKWEGQA